MGSNRVHRLAGALLSNNYHLGTFITTSSYTKPAVAASNQLPIQLVSGGELADAMVSNRIGVTRTDDGYELRAEFWDDLVAASERIPAGDVPLASNFDRIRAVLTAMKYTHGTANAIHRWVKENRPHEISSRHVYINSNAAAVLGLARTEPPTGDRSIKQWGLTGLGAQLITTAPGSEEEAQTYAEAIRGVELIKKLLVELRNRGELKGREIEGIIGSETTGLSEQSISRRGSSVRNWLQRLPEIRTEDSGSTLTYPSQ